MRPLAAAPDSIKEKYQSLFTNNLDNLTPKDIGTYIIFDYSFDKEFAKRIKLTPDENGKIHLLDFFQADAKLPKSKDYKVTPDLLTGHYFHLGDLNAGDLKITDDLTLRAKLFAVQKHTEKKRLFVYRLLLNKEDVENLLILQREKISLHKEVKLDDNLPTPIKTWDGLKKQIIDQLTSELTNIYKKAKEGLINSFGLYCAYCDSIITDGVLLDIEHKLPKEIFPDKKVNWDNFVIACKICNSTQKGQQPSFLFGKERIFYKGADTADLTTWKFSINISLSPAASRNTFKNTAEKLSTEKTTFKYDQDTGVLNIAGPVSDIDKEALKKGYNYDEFKTQVDSLKAESSVPQSINVLPLPQGMLDMFGPGQSKFLYNQQTKALIITGPFEETSKNTLRSFLDTTNDAKAIALLNKLFSTIDTIPKLNKDSDLSLITSGQLIVTNHNNNTLDLSYNNIRNQAQNWNLWPDDARNSISALSYEKTETYHETATNENYWNWTQNENNKYVVYEQTGNRINKVDVNVTVRNGSTTGAAELAFSAKSILTIAGLNNTKKQINDGRLLNRTRAWLIAEKQVRIILEEIANRKIGDELHSFFNDPVNHPTPPQFTDTKKTTEWNNKWEQLMGTLKNKPDILQELIWNNLIEIAQATGHYSVWVNVFLKLAPGEPGKELAEKFVNKMHERTEKDHHDPHAYRSTNTQFVKNFIAGL